jgi:hypothetical protein
MAVVDKNTNEWLNPDGLLVKFGTDRGREERGGEYSRLADGQHMVSLMIDLAGLPTAASGNEQIQCDYVTIPNGAFITKVRVTVLEEPTTSGSPNLDLGLVDQDRSTEIDFNGLLAAADAWETGTDLGTVTEYTKGTTEAGALVGTQITNTGLITASADTADWTDGTIKVDIEYYIPLTADL